MSFNFTITQLVFSLFVCLSPSLLFANACGDHLQAVIDADRKDKVEVLVESALQKYGFATTDKKSSKTWYKFRAWLLGNEIDPYQMKNANFREKLTEKIIDLKISENLLPYDDLQLSLKKGDRKKLRKIILRSIVNEGLAHLPESSNKNFTDKSDRAFRSVVHNPIFEFVSQLKLATTRHRLSKEQLQVLATGGVDALIEHPETMTLIKKEGRSQVVRGLYRSAPFVATALLAGHLYWNEVPQIQQVHAEQQFQQDSQALENLFDENILIHQARQDAELVKSRMEEINGEAVTAEEMSEIREYFCLTQYQFEGENAKACLAP